MNMDKKFSDNPNPVLHGLEIEPENIGPAAEAQGFGCLYFRMEDGYPTYYLLDIEEDGNPPEGSHYVGMFGALA